MSELKPCPFCGSAASLFPSSDHSTAWEGGCSNADCVALAIVWEPSKTLAVAAWNRRPKVKPSRIHQTPRPVVPKGG
jgi:hypothetical protein